MNPDGGYVMYYGNRVNLSDNIIRGLDLNSGQAIDDVTFGRILSFKVEEARKEVAKSRLEGNVEK